MTKGTTFKKLTTFQVRQALRIDGNFKMSANKQAYAQRTIDSLLASKQITDTQAESLYNWSYGIKENKQ